ncbi:MAG: isoleucine--tRNA ligase [Promethearchaeota archaeon]
MAKAPSYKPQYLKELTGNKSFVLPSKELEILDWWREEKIYDQIKKQEEGKPEFRFIDGPPYTTGSIHLGTAWNKVLKDIIIRFKRMTGFRVTDTPGYDTHGLPIEVQMEKQLKTKNKKDIIEKIGMDKFIDSCKEFALKNLDIMNEQFRRLGCEFWNWERPYVTLKESYVQGCWWMIKKAAEKDLLYLGNRPLNTCPRCETALAKHEYEYKNRVDTSIYVKYKIIGKENEFFVIWTTTPWTLVANMAIMANPDMEYVRVKVNDEVWILARNLAAMFVQAEVGVFPEIIETFTGDVLEGMRYIHPLLDEVPIQKEFFKENEKVHSIILTTEFVSATEGTGLVHCAPGHGPEDYHVAHVENGIVPFSPVNEEGKYFDEGGIFAGKNVFDANGEIIDILKKKGTLIVANDVEHEYAHCWRCKSPLVFRVLDQWYLKTNTLSKKMMAVNDEIHWVPDFAGDKNFTNWLENLQDWCISRQRFWGIPMPIWKCDDEECGDYIVIGSRKELEELSGVKPSDLHRPWVDKVTIPCSKCGRGTRRRVEDVVDVWLDSGCVMWASNEAVYGDSYEHGPEAYDEWKPADFILEGKDQIRGWFNSLMSCGILASNRPTYKNVVMHGFVTYEGEPMHKSRGNVVAPEEAIKRRGAETYRLYCVLNMSMGEDLNFYWREYDDTYKVINTLWNSYYYAKEMFALHDFKPSVGSPLKLAKNTKALEDKWIISRMQSLVKTTTELLNDFRISKYSKMLKDFIVNSLSKWYLKLIKVRLSEDADPTDKLNAMETLFYTLKTLSLIIAPVLPTISELFYRDFLSGLTNKTLPSIHLVAWPKVEESLIDTSLEELMSDGEKIVEKVRMLREENNLKLKWPCKELIVSGEKAEALKPLIPVLKREANVKVVTIGSEKPEGNNFIAGEHDKLGIFLDVSVDEEIMAERFFRDFFRQVQFLRKTAKLSVGDMIDLELQANEGIIQKYIQMFKGELTVKAYIKSLKFTNSDEMQDTLLEQDMKFCPELGCLVPIKSKAIEKAKKTNARSVKCTYCSKEYLIENLLSIKIRFKKAS